jgi:hypothetical protein
METQDNILAGSSSLSSVGKIDFLSNEQEFDLMLPKEKLYFIDVFISQTCDLYGLLYKI